jgi:actin-related protein 6
VAALRDVAQLALRRPVDRGFVVNTQLQRDIWERVFKHLLKVSLAATTCRL